MKHYLIAGNWKMHLGPREAEDFVAKLSSKVVQNTHVTSVLCPAAISIPAVVKSVESDVFRVGAQNIHAEDEGAYTGEISGPMLKEMVEYVIVGHSERRKYNHETDKDIAKKVAAALRHDLKPILCVGENLDDRHNGHHKRVVNDQLHGDLHQVTADELKHMAIAYEPVWAIGTGEFAKPEQVAEMVTAIRNAVEEMFGEGASSQVKILYGGSVTPDNAKSYLELDNVDGLLVGGASVNFEHFADIIKTAQKLTEK
jgi:triosephosphate isomerase